MITPLTQSQINGIINSFKQVCRTGDINSLTKRAYDFIMLSRGFIAHYNLLGFRDVYIKVSDLMADIVENKDANTWTNFRPGDENYEYYRQKAEIYAELVKIANSYLVVDFL